MGPLSNALGKAKKLVFGAPAPRLSVDEEVTQMRQKAGHMSTKQFRMNPAGEMTEISSYDELMPRTGYVAQKKYLGPYSKAYNKIYHPLHQPQAPRNPTLPSRPPTRAQISKFQQLRAEEGPSNPVRSRRM